MQPMFLKQLNTTVTNAETFSNSYGIFADGIKSMHMNMGKDNQAPMFKLLPGYDYQASHTSKFGYEKVPGSYVMYKDSIGDYTGWIRIVYVARFCGHGVGEGSNRTDILCLRTYDPKAQCPLDMVYSYAKSNQAKWGYLLNDITGPTGARVEGAPLPRVQEMAIANVIDVTHPEDGVKIGVFGASTRKALIGKSGLTNTINPVVTEADIAQNYINRWNCRDITDPNTGTVLTISEDTSKKLNYRSYTVTYALSNGRSVQYAVDQATLNSRLDLYTEFDSIVKHMTYDDIVEKLVGCLNQFGPEGQHEYELLHHLFGHTGLVPPVPEYSAPAAMPAPVPMPAPAMGPKVAMVAAPAPVPVQPYVPQQPATAPAPAAPAAPAVPNTNPVNLGVALALEPATTGVALGRATAPQGYGVPADINLSAPAAPAMPQAAPVMPAAPAAPAMPQAAPVMPAAPAAPAMPQAVPGLGQNDFDRSSFEQMLLATQGK